MTTKFDCVMPPRRRLLAHAGGLLMIISLVMGCQIYIDDDNDGGGGGGGGGGGDPILCELVRSELAPLMLRDPETGQCVDFSYPDTCSGEPGCLCPPPPLLPLPPSWSMCEGPCSNLSELVCMATDDCQAAYAGNDFAGCMGTAPDSVPSDDGCDGLDAWSCSRRDGCVALHAQPTQSDLPSDNIAVGGFLYCDAEPATCSNDSQCGLGFHCDSNDICLPPPDCDGGAGCIGICAGFCVPDPDYRECFGSVTCRQAQPACPSGTTPETRDGCYTNECVPLDECSPVPAESCYGEVFCDSLPPLCAANEVPQVQGGCWSGACVPEFLCEPDAAEASCSGLILCEAEPPICQEGAVPAIKDGCFTGDCIPLGECTPFPSWLTCTGEPSCERVPPTCPNAYVPLINGDCWQDVCVPVEMCS